MGRILVTTFGNPWRSLVRFDIGDVVRLDGHTPCPCGRREGLTLDVGGGTHGEPHADAGGSSGDARQPWIAPWALLRGWWNTRSSRQAPRPTIFASWPRKLRWSGVANEARDALRTVYGPAAVITTDPVEAIAPDPPGKYCLSKRLDPIDPDVLLDDQFAPRESEEDDGLDRNSGASVHLSPGRRTRFAPHGQRSAADAGSGELRRASPVDCLCRCCQR